MTKPCLVALARSIHFQSILNWLDSTFKHTWLLLQGASDTCLFGEAFTAASSTPVIIYIYLYILGACMSLVGNLCFRLNSSTPPRIKNGQEKTMRYIFMKN